MAIKLIKLYIARTVNSRRYV